MERFAGPYEDIPFDYYVQLPIGLIPKAGNKTCLIFHLSYEFKSGNGSVNSHTPKEKCTVKYNDLDEVIRKSLRLLDSLGKTSAIIWYGKTDVQSAFRLIPTKPGQWWLMIMKAQHPITHKWYYFVDKCLAFRHSISCAIFQHFSNVLAHSSRAKRSTEMKYSMDLTNYLDDFLFLALSQLACNQMLQGFLKICGLMGVPISLEKTEWVVIVIVFLGILLDGKRKILVIPEEKRLKALNTINELLDKRSAIVKELQSLAGLLNFLNRAIHPGRAFTRRMYSKFSGVVKIDGFGNKNRGELTKL